VGREAEQRAVSEALAARASLVTVVGPPGVGKSRLAREVAATQAAFGRVWWVDLRSLESAEALYGALAQMLGLPAEPNESAERRQARVEVALGEGGALCVLDDADHLVGPVAALARRVAGLVTLLVTSRRACEVEGERVVVLRGLGDEAPVLLRARLEEARLGRGFQAQAWACCEQIARLLGGTPLALELAAARLRQLTPARLLERLEQALGGAPSPLEALNAAVELSWDMLGEQERQVLSQCAVCEPGFGAELIERCLSQDAVCALDGLGALQQHGLVQFMDDGEALRGELPPTVRLFVLERLRGEPGTLEAVQARLVSACAELGREVYRRTCGVRFHAEVAVLVGELATLKRAYVLAQHAPAGTRVGLALGLTLALWRVGDLTLLREVGTWLKQALAQREEVDRWGQWAGWRQVASLGELGWERDGVLSALERSLEAAEAPLEVIRAKLSLAGVHGQALRLEEAMPHMIDAQRMLKRTPDLSCEAALRFVEGDIAMRQERLRESLALMREAATLAMQASEPHMRGRALVSLSFVSQQLGLVEETTAALEEAQDIFEEQGDVLACGHALHLLARYCVDEQRVHAAQQACKALGQLGQRYALGWARGFAQLLRGHLALDSGRFEDAALEYEQAHVIFAREGIVALEVAAALYLSLALEGQGEWKPARQRFDEAYARLDALGCPWARAHLRCVRAVWALRDQDPQMAARLLEQARAERSGSESPYHEPMVTLYTCMLDVVEWEQAQRQGKARQEQQALKQLLARLGEFMRVARPMLGRALELRVALRHIQQRLPVWLRARLALEADDPRGEALLLDEQILAYRAPGQDGWVDMAKRPTPMRLLLALVAHHRASPGAAIRTEALCEQVWPGERILPEAATNRLYVTIAGLRREGLREVIRNVEGGYALDASLRVVSNT
jgi:predicted ATPase